MKSDKVNVIANIKNHLPNWKKLLHFQGRVPSLNRKGEQLSRLWWGSAAMSATRYTDKSASTSGALIRKSATMIFLRRCSSYCNAGNVPSKPTRSRQWIHTIESVIFGITMARHLWGFLGGVGEVEGADEAAFRVMERLFPTIFDPYQSGGCFLPFSLIRWKRKFLYEAAFFQSFLLGICLHAQCIIYRIPREAFEYVIMDATPRESGWISCWLFCCYFCNDILSFTAYLYFSETVSP